MTPSPSPSPTSSVPNPSWMPFGGGRRYCVGAQLALLEMRVIIRQILDRMDLTAEDPEPERPQIRHVTLVPSRLTTVTAQSRATTTAETEHR